jgi:asparagine synthetase A
MHNVVETFEFLSKKVKLSIEELNQPLTKSKREELIEYQDRLMDSLFEEVDKIRESGDVETLESLLTKLQEIERLASR